MYYEAVFKEFKKWKVRYIIAGGMAVNLHGIPRFTKDLDILIDTSDGNLKKLEGALKKLHYRPKVPVTLAEFLKPANWPKWKKEKGMLAFNLYRPDIPYEEIDILVGTSVTFDKAAPRQVKIKVSGLMLSLVSIDDLIRMKRDAGRQQDLSDIVALKQVKKMKAYL